MPTKRSLWNIRDLCIAQTTGAKGARYDEGATNFKTMTPRFLNKTGWGHMSIKPPFVELEIKKADGGFYHGNSVPIALTLKV